MSLYAVLELNELLGKLKAALSRVGKSESCRGMEIVETFFVSNGGLEAGCTSKLPEDTMEQFQGYTRIVKHYLEDMPHISKQPLTKDLFTISVALFNRADNHDIVTVQKAIKRARLVLNDAQKDRAHWLWKEGLLK